MKKPANTLTSKFGAKISLTLLQLQNGAQEFFAYIQIFDQNDSSKHKLINGLL